MAARPAWEACGCSWTPTPPGQMTGRMAWEQAGASGTAAAGRKTSARREERAVGGGEPVSGAAG